jgi:hypothetical protein
LITGFAQALADAGVRVPAGCLRCGSAGEVAIVYGDGRCTRLCHDCRLRIEDEHLQRVEELNRPSFWFALGVPLVFLYVALGWATLWWLVDTILLWNHADAILLGGKEILLLLALLAALAVVMGFPIGIFLHRAGIESNAHTIAGSVIVLLACVTGEWWYTATVLYRHIHHVDLGLAAEALVPVFQNNQFSWKVGKVFVAVAIILGCWYAPKTRRTAEVKL